MEEVKKTDPVHGEAELPLLLVSSTLLSAPYTWQDMVDSSAVQIPITVHTISGHLARAIQSLKLNTVVEAP